MSAAFSAIMIDGRVGVAGHERGHDAAVDDAQALDAVHAQLGIDDGERVARRAHLAGAGRMEDRRAPAAREFEQVVVADGLRPGPVFAGDVGRERAGGGEAPREADARRRSSRDRAASTGSSAAIAGAASGSGDFGRMWPRDSGFNWHTDIVKPENVCTGEPAMSDDSVARWNCTSGRASAGSVRANMPPWLMPTAMGPVRVRT